MDKNMLEWGGGGRKKQLIYHGCFLFWVGQARSNREDESGRGWVLGGRVGSGREV